MATNFSQNSITKSPSFKILKAPVNLSEITSIINKIDLPPEDWYNRRQIITIYGIGYDRLRRKLLGCKGKLFFDLNINNYCLYYHINDIKRNIIKHKDTAPKGWYTAREIAEKYNKSYVSVREKVLLLYNSKKIKRTQYRSPISCQPCYFYNIKELHKFMK